MSSSKPGPRGELPIDASTIETQAPLPFVSIDVATPAHDGIRSVECPACHRDVADSRKAHLISVDLVDEPAIEARPIEDVPVYSWCCDYCDLVLPLDVDLAHREPSVAPPFDKWVTVAIETEADRRINAYVPAQEVIGR